MDRYAKAHENPQGPGDGRPTAEQILKDQSLEGKLTGKTVLITGGTAGLGKESARILHKTGVKVFITSRTQAKGDDVARQISANEPQYPPVEAIEMELSSFESVRRGAAAFLQKSKRLNILLMNAAIMAAPEGRTADGFETHFGTNHLAHFLLFQLLLQALKAGSTLELQSRVIVVSSSGHRMSGIHPDDYTLKGHYDPWKAYGQSKTSNIYLANEIERRYGSVGVHAMALHPGVIFETELSRHQGGGDDLEEAMTGHDPRFASYVRNTGQGSATQVWGCIAKELEGKGGVYLDDCQVAKETYLDDIYSPGWKRHAFDEGLAKRLWEDSDMMIGVEA